MKITGKLLLTGAAIATLSACSAPTAPSAGQSAAPASQPSSAGPAQDATTKPSPTPAGSAASGGSSGAASGTPKPTTSKAAQATSAAAAAGTDCDYSGLVPTLANHDGAAGSVYLTISLTNHSSAVCKLKGYPGVSMIGSGNGTQIGAPAKRDGDQSGDEVSVPPGGSTSFILRVTSALNYDPETCKQVKADGLRIYPPGSRGALFLQDKSLTGCANEQINLLTVRPVGATK